MCIRDSVPFCRHICSYCDFCKVFYDEKWAWDYLKALSFEIKDKALSTSYDSIYIGGGTPTALTYQQLQYLFELLKPFSKQVQEYSIEVNPETMDQEKLELCFQNGVNRLSIGVQTFRDDLLKKIGRVPVSYTHLQGVGEKTALKIIDYRQQHPFETIEDIMNISGIGEKTYLRLREHLCL